MTIQLRNGWRVRRGRNLNSDVRLYAALLLYREAV
jgi:hypothetical protein